MDQLTAVRAISRMDEFFLQQKIQYIQSSDFKEFRKIASMVRSNPVSGQFAKDHFDLHEANAFWTLCMMDGEPVSVQATRYEFLGDRTLHEHLPEQHERIYSKPNEVGTQHGPLLKRISGAVGYTGELEISKSLNGAKLGGLMTLLNIFLAFNKWPHMDWMYGFVAAKFVSKGLSDRMGFNEQQEEALHWIKTPPEIRHDDYLCAVRRQDIQFTAMKIAERGLGHRLPQQKA